MKAAIFHYIGDISLKDVREPEIEEATNENTTQASVPSHEQKFVLSEKEAKASSPEDIAVCGEEDPGVGLEFLTDESLNTHSE